MVLLWEFSGVGTMVPLPVAARLRACTQTGFDRAGSLTLCVACGLLGFPYLIDC